MAGIRAAMPVGRFPNLAPLTASGAIGGAASASIASALGVERGGGTRMLTAAAAFEVLLLPRDDRFLALMREEETPPRPPVPPACRPVGEATGDSAGVEAAVAVALIGPESVRARDLLLRCRGRAAAKAGGASAAACSGFPPWGDWGFALRSLEGRVGCGWPSTVGF